MSFSGGVFSINTTGQPVVSGTTISASVFNSLTADLATGLSTCILKDGTQTTTATIPFATMATFAGATSNTVSAAGTTSIRGGQIGFPATQVPSTDPNTLDDYEEGNFTGTLTGCTTAPTDVIYYTKIGNQVTIQAAVGFSAVVSNAVTKTITGMPAAIRPGRDMYGTIDVIDNGGTEQKGTFSIASTGVIALFPTAARGNWTNSGNFSTEPIVITYQQS